jgi:phosphate/sulfate permease
MNMTKSLVILFAAVGTAFSAGNASAGLTMTQRETVQDISWSVEFLAILAALVIAVFVWRLGKRDIKNRKNRNEGRQDITSD